MLPFLKLSCYATVSNSLSEETAVLVSIDRTRGTLFTRKKVITRPEDTKRFQVFVAADHVLCHKYNTTRCGGCIRNFMLCDLVLCYNKMLKQFS